MTEQRIIDVAMDHHDCPICKAGLTVKLSPKQRLDYVGEMLHFLRQNLDRASGGWTAKEGDPEVKSLEDRILELENEQDRLRRQLT